MEILPPNPNIPVASWTLVIPGLTGVTGFRSVEAAQAWASEWRADRPDALLVPCQPVGTVTRALALFERDQSSGLDSSAFD